MGAWTPANDFTCLVVSSPDLTAGDYTLWQGDAQLAGSASDSAGGPGGMGGGRPMDGGEPPATLILSRRRRTGPRESAPSARRAKRRRTPAARHPLTRRSARRTGRPRLTARNRPRAAAAPGGEGGQMMAADLSETFTLADGGNFFTGVSPLETEETSGT